MSLKQHYIMNTMKKIGYIITFALFAAVNVEAQQTNNTAGPTQPSLLGGLEQIGPRWGGWF